MKKRKSDTSDNERALANAPIATQLINQEIVDLHQEIMDLIVAHTKMSAKQMRRWLKEKDYLKDNDFAIVAMWLIITHVFSNLGKKPDLREDLRNITVASEVQLKITRLTKQISELKQKRAKLAPGDDEEVSLVNTMLNEISSRSRKRN